MLKKLKYGEYFGTAGKQLSAGDFLLTRTQYKRKEVLPPHEHENHVLYLILNGRMNELYSRKSNEFTAGDIIVHPANHAHSNEFNSSYTDIFNIEFSGGWLSKHSLEPGFLNNLYYLNNHKVSSLFLKIYSEFLSNDELSRLVIEGLMLEVTAELGRVNCGSHGMPYYVKKAGEIINEQFNKELSIQYIASELCIHPVYFAKLFKKHTGFSTGEYIRKIRVERASEMLSGSSASLAEIAYSCGFFDQSHFSKIFKKLTGLSPARYRAAHSR
jgi:AraC-like DNA-binding protein